ncbi:alkaline-phosphatase-like protein [Coniella lustricola]|uniref:Alkaline-phosphatase-like protein n=1 Tax=Coniella lustricola TaxID=2025994 RepID=A0A2T3AE05_9PEZI|nr:alkaline-phosphatase-like protein [Coniella lustricola]
MPLLKPLNRPKSPNNSLLSAKSYDPDANSLRSDQDSDSDDDERQARARNSRELRAHDRIVLLEEEEMDQLVIDARRQKARERRASSNNSGGGGGHENGRRRVSAGLSIRTPLQLFSGGSSSNSAKRSVSGSIGSRSVSPAEKQSLIDMEERQQRRQRRRQKKERLLEKAAEGEDGELMYEMEEGGMKTGSSLGNSDLDDNDNGRDDSDELDRSGLRYLADSKRQRGRAWWRWVLIYVSMGVAFAVIAVLAWRMSARTAAFRAQTLFSNGTALFAPTTLILSLDGFRADFLERGLTPRLNAFIKEGVSPLYMKPSFPSVTFPNHFTLATGLYPEAHGIVGNTFWDPALEQQFYYTDTAVSMQSKWWNGEPFWVTAERHGIRTALHMWPGSEAHLGEVTPAFLDEYNGREALANKASRILSFLDLPGLETPSANTAEMRPQLIAAYVPNVDADGHKYGPNSTEIRSTIANVDEMLDGLFAGLAARNLTDIVNVIVVSDHGMATTDISRMIQLEDLVDLSQIAHVDGWPLVGLRPKNESEAFLQDMYQGLMTKAGSNPNFDVYLRDSTMPERYHFSQNERIAPLWIVPKTGWAIVDKEEFDIEAGKTNGVEYHPKGLHGYDFEHPLMRAIFVARGPAFPHQPGSRVEPFQNTEVYNILCDSIGLTPAPNNGTLRLPLQPVGLHDEVPGTQVPSDPVTSYTLTSTSTPVPTKTLGVDPVVTGDVSSPVTVDPPEINQDEDEVLNPSTGTDDFSSDKDLLEWVKDTFGKAWSWTVDEAGKAWAAVHGGQPPKIAEDGAGVAAAAPAA